MFNEKIKENKKKVDVLVLNFKNIIKQLKKYNLLNTFSSKAELYKWLIGLNQLEKNNILSLNVEPTSIKFNLKLLINRNLLNTLDYNKRIRELISIKNAEGWYHLFDRMLELEFLNSGKFYQDIETLKRAKCAQTSLWIIGDYTFINSPYHDEDFELLVTSKDNSGKDFDYVVWDSIATVAKSYDSIYSKYGYHRKDLQTIVKYGATALQMSGTYPESGINKLAIHPISLKDKYHLENMEILAQNQEIGNFLYAVMASPIAIKKRNYRDIIREMVEHKNNISYVFLICYYAIGEKGAIDAQNILEHNYFYEIKTTYNIDELLEKVDEKFNVVDGEVKDITVYEIENKGLEYNNQEVSEKNINLIRSVFKKNKTRKKE